MKFGSRLLAFLLFCALILPLGGCESTAEKSAPAASPTAAAPAVSAPDATRYSRREYDLFDTEVILMGFAASQEEFTRVTDRTVEQLREYNRIFDGYNAYGDLHNLYYVNEHAAQAPVEVPQVFFDLLIWCRDQWQQGYRKTNIAMGAVLKIWHDYRTEGINHPENAQLPPAELLSEAAGHTRFDDLVLDKEGKKIIFRTVNDVDPGSVTDTSLLFNRFYRTDESRSRDTGGYGIGLSIAQAVADAHGGSISAKQEGGKITFRTVL